MKEIKNPQEIMCVRSENAEFYPLGFFPSSWRCTQKQIIYGGRLDRETKRSKDEQICSVVCSSRFNLLVSTIALHEIARFQEYYK
jgi:hypothetical protein